MSGNLLSHPSFESSLFCLQRPGWPILPVCVAREARIEHFGYDFSLSLGTYRLTNHMLALNMLLRLLGEAPSTPLPLPLQASFSIPLALPDEIKRKRPGREEGGRRGASSIFSASI